MPLAPPLFGPLDVPLVWVTLHAPEPAEADDRKVTVRLKATNSRSVSATVTVSRYSPEASIFVACSRLMGEVELHQGAIRREWLQSQLEACIAAWVEPF